jgi:hypothetical protein
MQVEQNYDSSDIAHGSSRILNVPTDMDKSWVSALDAPSLMGLVVVAAVAGGIISLALGKSVFKK